jgi:hypothetical protein
MSPIHIQKYVPFRTSDDNSHAIVYANTAFMPDMHVGRSSSESERRDSP